LKGLGIVAVALGLFSLLGAALKLGLLGPPSSPPALGPEIAWQTSAPQGLELAARERRPAILDFVSDTCTVCREIEKTTFRDPRVVEKSKDFVMIQVDTSDGRNEDLARHYRVKGLPTILFMDRAGRERGDLAIQGGYVGPDEFLRKMSEALPAN
jgi:thiol:disulfide interchange protein DsbD